MTPSENIALMKRWYREVWREGKNETIYELMAPDGVAHGHYGTATEVRGPDEFVAFAEMIRRAFPDGDVVVDDAFGVDDKVAIRWTATMTHTGDGFGVPTGKKISFRGMTIARLVDGKIVEGWDNWDRLGMLEQIGIFKSAEEPQLAKTA
jgi:steroid delta-isomerase-like uncharacterized protein